MTVKIIKTDLQKALEEMNKSHDLYVRVETLVQSVYFTFEGLDGKLTQIRVFDADLKCSATVTKTEPL